ncbi:hypothetical protein TNCV_2106781 [Trichonephila clavipes]|nr:hypothetical protein TNCV_2106781 [Trichonephila clavipes]
MHIPLPNNRILSGLQRANNDLYPYLDRDSDEISHHSTLLVFKSPPPFPSLIHLHDGGVLFKSIPPICYSLVKVNVTQVPEEDGSRDSYFRLNTLISSGRG